MLQKPITSHNDVYRYFPKTVQEVHDYAQCTRLRIQKAIDELIKQDVSQATFDSVARALDTASSWLTVTIEALSVLEMVSPDKTIREKAQEENIAIRAFAVDVFSNKQLYEVFKHYNQHNAQQETLTAEQRYFLDETIKDFERQGLNLPQAQLDEINAIRKELEALGVTFESNIATDNRTVAVTHEALEGLDEHVINGLKRDDQGNYLLGCDYPTVNEVCGHCSVEATRKKLYLAFNNRAYPQNKELLDTIIAKRDLLAHKLGFDSYAALDIDATMANSVERAESFIADLAQKVSVKTQQEIDELKRSLPQKVSLDQGKIKPWDLAYIKECYKRDHFNLDERKVAEYFEVEQTLNGIFSIYQRFLSLEFKMFKPAWAWDDDVRLIEVIEVRSKKVRGYIFLDLYPRPNKYSHACHCGVVSSIKTYAKDGAVQKSPSVAVVIANFPRASKERPALLKHRDVETFFHEFGHAMHFVLGGTELASFAGTATKLDFVEMPSQMFEEWMFDEQMLKNLGKHYQTGKPLPDDTIKTMLALKKFDSGYFVSRQCGYALLSLAYFKAGAQKDTDAISRALQERTSPQILFEPETHFQYAFGHLTGYGAKYYSYMWSKVYALDIFETIRAKGLLNPQAGTVLTNKILAYGGSVDPNKLLRDYLGREPQQDAFLKDIGLQV